MQFLKCHGFQNSAMWWAGGIYMNLIVLVDMTEGSGIMLLCNGCEQAWLWDSRKINRGKTVVNRTYV